MMLNILSKATVLRYARISNFNTLLPAPKRKAENYMQNT